MRTLSIEKHGNTVIITTEANCKSKQNVTQGCVSSCVASHDCAQRNSCYKADTDGAFLQCECSCVFSMFYGMQSSCHTEGRGMVVLQNALLGVPSE
jgi:hypothetical protein